MKLKMLLCFQFYIFNIRFDMSDIPSAPSMGKDRQNTPKQSNDYWNLPVAFYFQITLQNQSLAFKEVSGLSTEVELEEVVEGGLNEYVHKLPKQIKHGNLIFKRALRTTKYTDVIWIRDIVEGVKFDSIKTKDIVISLLNADEQALASWTCQKAFPVKWEIDSLDSERNSVLIETLEFSYTKLIRQR